MVAAVALAVLVGAPAAFAGAPHWKLNSGSAPTYLAPGGSEVQQVRVVALNLGDAGAAAPVTVTDRLPAGVVATGVSGEVASNQQGHQFSCLPLPALSCTWTGRSFPPYERLEMIITVQVSPGASTGEENEVTVQGGNTPSASLRRALAISSKPTPFGIESYELNPENEDGSPDLQAGSHPFQLTTHLDFNQTLPSQGLVHYPGVPALVKDLHVTLPPGLVGDANANASNAIAQCSIIDFTSLVSNVNFCPPDTAVGVASVALSRVVAGQGHITKAVPVFNLVPAPGEPARFGFETSGVPVYLDTEVRSGKDYAVVVSVKNASQSAELLGSDVTIWGVPGDPRHDQSRGWNCVLDGFYILNEGESCTPLSQTRPPAYLTLPTSCEGHPETTVAGDSWPTSADPGGSGLEARFIFPSSLDGCSALPFSPSLDVQPDQHSASTPTGLKVEVKLPQETILEPSGLAESDLRQTVVALPEGLLASPGAAGGLLACSAVGPGFGFIGSQEGLPESAQLQNDHFSSDAASCPDASKIGKLRIKSPLLSNELTGSVYLAQQDTNPFKSPLVLYLFAEDPVSGVRAKLAGEVQIDPTTGRLTSTFRNTPQVPFEELELQLFEGSRAANSTPPLCGGYTTTSSFTPWSGEATASPSSHFDITSGPGGGSCPSSPLPFSPALDAGSTNNQAAGFTGPSTPFTLTINHPDSDQALTGLTMQLPPGIAAMLSSVAPCPIAIAEAGQCGGESLIGHSTTSSGLGGEPYSLAGQVFLTGPYHGAPFGISVLTPAEGVGPFHLGKIIANSTIQVDQGTAAVSITTVESRVIDPAGATTTFPTSLPTIINGVPVQLKRINVSVDRAGFQFNPTNCSSMAITGALTGAAGASKAFSTPFQVANCAKLPFAPKLTASTQGNASKANGTSLKVTVSSSPGQANIAKTKLTLPVVLPSRLTTIQKACLDHVFNANPAACPEGSNIGFATVHTPVLKSPLIGPAYLVSHGNAAFPDIEFVLQGEGIKLILDGQTNIKNGITTSTFNAVPDAPFTTFETILPAGPHSALTSNVAQSKNFSLCGSKPIMPTTITGQNGAVVTQQTRIGVTGCKGVKGFKATRAQLLAKALKACRKKSSATKRASCEKQARKKYGHRKVRKK